MKTMDLRDPPYSWGRLQVVKHQPRSVSQAKEYGDCAYRYFLNRVVRAWDRPAAWFPLGLAVHGAAEWWEKGERKASVDEMVSVFKNLYRDHVDQMLKDTPNVWFWFEAGPYKGQAYIDRNFVVGQEQVRRYYDYYVNQQPGEVIWITPKGEPAIELGFEFDLDGVKIIGLLDQIIEVRPPKPRTPSGAVSKSKALIEEWEAQPNKPRIRDLKTGQNPGDTLQLKVYELAVEAEYGVEIGEGDYLMTKTTGHPTQAYDLTKMSTDQVAEVFVTLDEGVKAERFDPSPSEKNCRRCGVASACAYREV